MNRRVALAAPLACALFGCVSVAEFRKLETQVNEVRGGEVGAQTRSQLAELVAQVDRMSKEVDELRGQMEVAQHRADQAIEEARSARSDADAAARAAQEAVPSPAPAAPAESDAGSEAAAPSVETAAADAVEGSPGAVPSGSSEEVARYREAYNAWRRNEVQACIDGFRDFLQDFKSSPYSDEALYWMADCYSKQGDHEKAILRFAKVVELYPSSNKAPDALFRQGEVLLKLGPGYANAARDVFQRVVSEYPDSSRADEARRQLEILGAGAAAGTGR